MRKLLIIDRDGTLVIEPPIDKQLDAFNKLEFYPGVFTYLAKISKELDFELIMFTNQDGLGTASFPENTFWPVHNFVIKSLQNEGISFENVLIDSTFPMENAATRKPGIELLKPYLNGAYDLTNSFVIGDRVTDVQLAKNLGAQAIYLSEDSYDSDFIALQTRSWQEVFAFLKGHYQYVKLERKTNETSIQVELNLNGNGLAAIDTGIAFFNHMLAQICRHGMIDLKLKVDGDLDVDEHHSIEDTAIVLGQAFNQALKDKSGMKRYGFLLPMDDCLAQVAIDFGGRSWFVWDVDFIREKIGDMPTEMFYHFFKSFSDEAKCNLNIKAEGRNEHHKIESIFKAFAKSIRMAIIKELNNSNIPSSKGVI